MIPVTKPYLPPKAEFDAYVNAIWERNWLTNNGPFVNELELNLKKYLKEKHLLFLNNGTIAIQLAIKALDLQGEIITTPFSYVATTSSIVWEGATPVFVDIDENTLNIDATKIEAAITPKTTGIIATHVYGNPCDVEAIEKIAVKHNLKVIYDAAHAFGVTYKGKSLFGYGDISTTSFHATKLFHTIEGGAVFTQEPNVLKRLSFMRSFGHDGPYDFAEVGINGKNSVFNAAMGLCNLKYIDEIIAKRKILFERYNAILKPLNARRPQLMEGTAYNYAYYPIIFDTAEQMQKTLTYLNRKEVFPRRYFYPSLAKLNYVENVTMPITEDIAERVICLPFYYDLSVEEVDYIARLCLRVQNYE